MGSKVTQTNFDPNSILISRFIKYTIINGHIERHIELKFFFFDLQIIKKKGVESTYVLKLEPCCLNVHHSPEIEISS